MIPLDKNNYWGEVVLFLVRTAFLWILTSTIINAYLMTLPIPVLRKRDYPANYLIKQDNRIDIQNKRECAAFSTAYVLRHFGMEADGEKLYTNFPSKIRSGNVYPKGIRTVLRNMGFKTNYYKGNILLVIAYDRDKVQIITILLYFNKYNYGRSFTNFVL